MTTQVTDPVCKMRVSVGDNTLHADYSGERHYFCSRHCQEKFQANPAAYLKPQGSMPEQSGAMYTCPMHPEVRLPSPGNCPQCGMTLEAVEPAMIVSSTAEYTCPMHPEVVRNGPGSCPICGMALEPRNAPSENHAELDDMTRRLKISAALAAPVFVMAMVSELAPATDAGFCFDDRVAMAGICLGHAGGMVGRLAELSARCRCREPTRDAQHDGCGAGVF